MIVKKKAGQAKAKSTLQCVGDFQDLLPDWSKICFIRLILSFLKRSVLLESYIFIDDRAFLAIGSPYYKYYILTSLTTNLEASFSFS